MKSNKFIFRLYLLFIIAGFSFSACRPAGNPSSIAGSPTPEVLILGGGDHHDFDRWFNVEDSTIFANSGANVRYTNDPSAVLPALSEVDVLNINTNQAIEDPEFPVRVMDFVEEGNGLLLVHAATWFLWDWPEYYRDIIGGGTSSHGRFGEFEVYVTDTDHPLTENMPERFTIKDELYRFQRDEAGAKMHVLAMGIEPGTGNEYPVVWTVAHGDGKVVNITLGHDGEAHQHEAFITLMENSIEWLAK